MENSEIKLISEKIEQILNKITVVDNSRIALVSELKALCPIKEGDKVSIQSHETKEHIRFAFVYRIGVNLRGGDGGKARLEFALQKCKADGTLSQHDDRLKSGEYIKRISK